MSYNPTNWVNGETPINDSNLNHIEQGIKDVADLSDAQETKIADIANNQIPEEYLQQSVNNYIANNQAGLATKTDVTNLDSKLSSEIEDLIDTNYIEGVTPTWNVNGAINIYGVAVTDATLFNYRYSDFVKITNYVRNSTITNLYAEEASTIVGLAFYNAEKRFIAYYNKVSKGSYDVDMKTIIENYPNAKYIKMTKLTGKTVDFVNDNKLYSRAEIEKLCYPPYYKFNMFSSILCGGDSVTEGFVVEGTQSNPQSIYEVMDNYSYPTQLGKILPQCNITKKAKSGFNCSEWYNKYMAEGFTQYDMVILELGLNGYLNINDIDVEGTNSNYYKKIVTEIHADNPNCKIVLVRSSHFSDDWLPVLNALADLCGGVVIDLKDTTYLNLDSAEYHGYYNNNGVASMDWAHFTRNGYNAKAYVISRLIADKI